MAGKRINLSDLADEPELTEARLPTFADLSPRAARLDQIAPNPLNTRDVHAHPARIASIADSMRVHGQLQPCAVVSRSAFLGIFQEHRVALGQAAFVQVTGGRRYAAAVQIGLPTLDIVVKDHLADSRVGFIGATAAENIDRQDYDPIEEARQVEVLVAEAGSGAAAAAALTRTAPWVTQRLNLLKLAPELQAAVRSGDIPLREVRSLHLLEVNEQVKALRTWESRNAEPVLTAVNAHDEQQVAAKKARTRSSPSATAIRRLGGTPTGIAESLRAELSEEDLRELIELLLQGSPRSPK